MGYSEKRETREQIMDLSRGCILLARSIDKSDIFQNEKWLKVWIWCLIQANHKGKYVPVKTGKYETVVKLVRGQFIFGRNKAAEILNMKPSTVRNIMVKLEKLQNMDIKKDSHFSVVTIKDYDFYQNLENFKGQATGQPEDRQRTTRGQAKDTTKNVNKPNNENNDINKPKNVNDQIWNDWVSHRKSKKAKVTKTVISGFTSQAEKAGISLEDAFKESIERNWVGFKAEWYLKDNKAESNEFDFL